MPDPGSRPPVSVAKSKIDKAEKAFEKGDYQKAVNLLEGEKNTPDYRIQRILGYSYAALKKFDDAIVAFEKTLEQRKVPENGYSLAYLYEITGRTKVARMLYEDLLGAELPPKMLKGVYEGLSRTSVFENDTRAAFKYNMEMVKKYPDSPEGFIALLKIIRNTGRLKGLENLVALGDNHHLQNFEYNFWLGVLYFETGNFKPALERFKRCTEIDPSNSTPYYYTYRILKRQKNIEEALNELEKYHKLNPLLPHIFFEAAIDAKNEGRLDLAYKFLRSAYTMDRTLLGRDDKGTMREIERMVKNNGSDLDKKFLSAFINYINGDHKIALEQIRHLLPKLKSTELENDAKRIQRECINLERQEMDYQNYLDRLERQKKLQQQALLNAAETKQEFENETEAELIMKKAMINPNDLRLQYQAGLQLARIGALEDAKRFFDNALRINPNILEANYSMAKVLIFQQNYRRAREYIDRALKINPNNSQTLSISAYLHFLERDYSRARSDAEGALKANPNNGEARMVLAEVAMRNNDFRTALKEVNMGLEVERDPERRKKLLNIKKSIPNF
ncbi:MAG: hypothetical protein Kow0029_18890 [Candidatus Rifleibacteriota bacterium]